MIADLRACIGLLSPGLRRRWALLVPLGIASASAETFGAAAVFALITIIDDPSRAASLRLAAPIYARLLRRDEFAVLVAFALAVLLLYLLRNALIAGAASMQEGVMTESVAEVSERLLAGYLAAPYEFHFRRDSAALIQRAGESVNVVMRTVLASVVNLVTEVLVVAGILAVLAASAPRAAVMAVAVMLALLLVPLALTRRVFARWGRERHEREEALLRRAQQSLGAFKEARIAGRERFFLDAFAAEHRGLARLSRLEALLSTLLRLGVETVFVVGLLLVVVVAAPAVGGATRISTLGLFAYAGFRVIPSVNRILLHVNQMRYGRPFVRLVSEDFAALAGREAPAAEEAAPAAVPFARSIVLDGVSYGYGGRGDAVLDRVDLEIHRGESLGIVGASGAGKSTLVDLLLGLLEPTAGRVLVDGQDIRVNPRGWQQRIGYVPQEPFLFDDTLRRNIAFGLRDEGIAPRGVEAAVRQAGLESFVASLPAGLDTLVGERGARLSGGERQRVAIARALYRDPDVLVFDEATSALDHRVEREITRALGAQKGARTLVIIAHRLTTLRECDRLAIVEGGRIADLGTFEELLGRNAGFRELARIGSLLEQTVIAPGAEPALGGSGPGNFLKS